MAEEFSLTVHQQDVIEQLSQTSMAFEDIAYRILQMVGDATIAYLRSYTSEMRPPARSGDTKERPAHPGHWADDTGALAGAYRYEVQRRGGEVRLVLLNDMEYAIYLEVRDGFFVLSGVTDPGGPVENALRQALAPFPGIEIRNG